MRRIAIAIAPDWGVQERPQGDPAPLDRMIAALKVAIGQTHPDVEPEIHPTPHLSEILSPASDTLVCPLTLKVPPTLDFPGRNIYQTCADVAGLQTEVVRRWNYPIGEGNFWLPIVLTARGPLYGEAIGKASAATASATPADLVFPPAATPGAAYLQPVHFPDARRQPLYAFAHELLQELSAPPATYLMQFGLLEDRLSFDRLWPFPATPALASLGVQVPDLFACHWYCLTHRPILDLTIRDSLKV